MNTADFGQLQVFHAIVRLGSIAATARQLGISSPAVSKSLKLLEQTIGAPLFQRSTHKLTLTDMDERLWQQTKDPLGALNGAFAHIQEQSHEPGGRVAITTSRVAYQLFLREKQALIQQRYPAIQLDIYLDNATLNLVEEGLDMGIRFGNVLEEGMVARKLLPPAKLGLYASERYVKRFGLPENIDALARHKLIAFRLPTANRLHPVILKAGGQEISVTMPVVQSSNDMDLNLDAIELGIGIGQLFAPLASDRLIPVLPGYWPEYPPLYLCYLKSKTQSRRVLAVIECLMR